MVREVITVNIGQAGIQLGQEVWSQFNTEHHITDSGETDSKEQTSRYSRGDKEFTKFYSESSEGRFVPRNVSVDLEPNVIDNVKSSRLGESRRQKKRQRKRDKTPKKPQENCLIRALFWSITKEELVISLVGIVKLRGGMTPSLSPF